MPRFAANLSMMYPELPFMARFEAAAADGFRAVECLFPYEHPAAEVRAALRDNGLEQVLFNTPPGDWARGERGFAAVPGAQAVFERGLDQAIDYALAIGCTRLHLMSGLIADRSRSDEHRATLIANLRRAAPRLQAQGLTGLIEPINARDIPGYFLNTQAQAWSIIDEIGAASVRLQMDLYHCQIVEGDVSTRLREGFPRIAHVQIAGVPGRHEPDIGELHYPCLFDLLDELGYAGWVGCEYRPQASTREGLARWFGPWRADS